jgi:hypothetical protein
MPSDNLLSSIKSARAVEVNPRPTVKLVSANVADSDLLCIVAPKCIYYELLTSVTRQCYLSVSYGLARCYFH